MDYSTPGFPVLHYFLEFAQTHVHVRSNTTTIYCSSHSQVRKVELREVNFPQIRQLRKQQHWHVNPHEGNPLACALCDVSPREGWMGEFC